MILLSLYTKTLMKEIHFFCCHMGSFQISERLMVCENVYRWAGSFMKVMLLFLEQLISKTFLSEELLAVQFKI